MRQISYSRVTGNQIQGECSLRLSLSLRQLKCKPMVTKARKYVKMIKGYRHIQNGQQTRNTTTILLGTGAENTGQLFSAMKQNSKTEMTKTVEKKQP